MKIEKPSLNYTKNKIIKLKLIQTKIFTKKQYLNNIKIEDIEFRLKKLFYIIYKYHIFNKKILFIGTPLKFYYQITNLFKITKHIFIPFSILVKGVLSNKNFNFNLLINKKKNFNNNISELLLKLKKTVDLIIIFNKFDNNKEDIINEAYISKIPTILINTNLNILNNKPTYKIPGNFQFNNKKIRNNLFYSLLTSTLKKGQKDKHLLKKQLILGFKKKFNFKQKDGLKNFKNNKNDFKTQK